MDISQNTDYLLGHVPVAQENPRLNTQHERITHGIMNGKLLHESIPPDKLEGPIADLCCGTGVWLDDLSRHFARSNRHDKPSDFVGFDLNPLAFRDRHQLDTNVQLVQHDCVKPFDTVYVGKFGLVNMRGLAYAIPSKQLSTLFRNAVSLLKPGGFLQWLDTESQLWNSHPESADFGTALGLVSRERSERGLVQYMPDFMIQEYVSTCTSSRSKERDRLSLLHFGLEPGGAARPETGIDTYLNNCFSDTVFETLELLLQGYRERSVDEVAGLKKSIAFAAAARKSREIIVCGRFPLLVAQKAGPVRMLAPNSADE